MRETEQDSRYNHLEKKTIPEIIAEINKEDRLVSEAVSRALPDVQNFLSALLPKMIEGGRLFYIGAGTSGRLGVLDASECPPTFGVSDNVVIGIIAGGNSALRKAVEGAEDSETLAWTDLDAFSISEKDSVLGIAASGTTPYVLHGIIKAKAAGCLTGALVCSSNSLIARAADMAIEVITGPEYVSGSTRMKAGTAQKMILNTISTTAMIKLGRVKGNKMVDMQLSNAKLIDRGVRMIMEQESVSKTQAESLLLKYGSVRKALLAKKKEG